jgi:hypothetical protein
MQTQRLSESFPDDGLCGSYPIKPVRAITSDLPTIRTFVDPHCTHS